MKCVTCCCF